jgi:hypothetical protein
MYDLVCADGVFLLVIVQFFSPTAFLVNCTEIKHQEAQGVMRVHRVIV